MRLALAQQAAEDGDYALAISLWEEALPEAGPAQRGGLAISLARAYIEEQRQREAVALLGRVISETTSTAQKTEATGLLAVCYEDLGAWREAIAAYELYLEQEQAAAPDVRWHMAKAYEALGEDSQAGEQLAAIGLTELAPAERAEVLEELAAVRQRLRDFGGALAAYDEILGFSTRAEYRALILQKKGLALRDAGRRDEAVTVLGSVLQDYPATQAAYPALLALDELGATGIDDLLRAEILSRAGELAASIDVLERYAASHAGENVARVHYAAGLAYEGQGQYQEAFQEYDLVIERYPQDPLAPAAWMAKAHAAAAYGGDPSGLYHEFVQRYPDHVRAPEALWLGAVALERSVDWQQSASFYHRLSTAYPQDQRASEAAFREGLALYALKDASAALKLWSDALQGDLPGDERARRLTWLGLAAKAAGDLAAAHRYWGEAMTASPWSYYGLRARDLDAGVAPWLPPEVQAALPEGKLTERDWGEMGSWVSAWPQSGSGESRAGIASGPTQGTMSSDEGLVLRGAALLNLGWHDRALGVYGLLRDRARDAPQALLTLARATDEAGLHAVTIYCAERLIGLGRKAGAIEPPQALLKLSYPTHFARLVRAEAELRAVDPLLFLALIRQESRFDPRAISYAGATGLAQVMPATGTWIASRIGLEPYSTSLLTRPGISVRFGVWYLAELLELYDRDWLLALAAYNAGPGNVQRWTNGQDIADPDLFVETLPAAQTKDYVRGIYQQYRFYESIYSRTAHAANPPRE
jgi:soluble lytic murein transglycosylase